MKPDTIKLLARSAHDLDYARRFLGTAAPDAAARSCYHAVFHAAMALLDERQDSRPKTHRGVHARFAAAVMADASLPPSMSEFLVYAYRFKQVADYDMEPNVDRETAVSAIAEAEDFVARIIQALERPIGD